MLFDVITIKINTCFINYTVISLKACLTLVYAFGSISSIPI